MPAKSLTQQKAIRKSPRPVNSNKGSTYRSIPGLWPQTVEQIRDRLRHLTGKRLDEEVRLVAREMNVPMVSIQRIVNSKPEV